MVLPLILGGIALVSSGIALYESWNTEPTQQNQYITNNSTQIKNNEIIIGSNSKVGELTIKDKLTATQTAKGQQTATTGISPLLLAVGGAGAVYLITRGKK